MTILIKKTEQDLCKEIDQLESVETNLLQKCKETSDRKEKLLLVRKMRAISDQEIKLIEEYPFSD